MFDDAPGHQFQLMNPDLAVVGVNQLDVQLGAFFGTAYISCIDTGSARLRPRPPKPRLYTYIGPNGTAPVNPRRTRSWPAGSSMGVVGLAHTQAGARPGGSHRARRRS